MNGFKRETYNVLIIRDLPGGACGVCEAEVLADGTDRIVSSGAVSCVWTGTPRFDAWFRARYEPFEVVRLGEILTAME
jgi:hypothetical protein